MCEYCGCEEVPAIAALIGEHDEIRAAARDASRAARAGDRAGGAAAAARLLDLLAPHTKIEELGLFPAMSTEFAEHVASLENDHDRIETALARAAAPNLEDTATWVGDLEAALAELFEHILREQDGLFPAALAVLQPQDWEVLDGVRARIAATQLAATA